MIFLDICQLSDVLPVKDKFCLSDKVKYRLYTLILYKIGFGWTYKQRREGEEERSRRDLYPILMLQYKDLSGLKGLRDDCLLVGNQSEASLAQIQGLSR